MMKQQTDVTVDIDTVVYYSRKSYINSHCMNPLTGETVWLNELHTVRPNPIRMSPRYIACVSAVSISLFVTL